MEVKSHWTNLLKKTLQFVHEGRLFVLYRSRRFTERLCESLDDFPLFRRDFYGYLDANLDELISATTDHSSWNSLAFDAKDASGLCACGDAQFALALERPNLDLPTECRDGERDGNGTQDVISCATEKLVGCDPNRQLQIARTAIGTCAVASSLDQSCRAIFDAWRDRDLDRFFLRNESCAMTIRARIGHETPSASTTCAWFFDGDRKHALLHANASASVAQVTTFRLRTFGRSYSDAVTAGLDAIVREFLRASEGGFFEADFYLFLKVPSIADFDAERPEQIAEDAIDVDVVDVDVACPAEGTGRLSARSTHTHRAKPIESRTFLRVTQDLISRVDFLEPLLSTVVAGVFVRVMLRREFAERAFDLVLRCCTTNTENVVGIAHEAPDSTDRTVFPASDDLSHHGKGWRVGHSPSP